MTQVPHYLIIGNGRVARHFQCYFTLLNIPFSVWHRRLSISQLELAIKTSTHALILINDSAIEEFAQLFLLKTKLTLIHFSGSLSSDIVIGAHPLMSFTETMYELERYQTIPFTLDDDAPPFENLFPDLINPHVRLAKIHKAKYHALCVLSTYSSLLWQKVLSNFENEYGFPPSIAHPYLMQQTKNLIMDYKSAFTGPLVRDDIETINKHLVALQSDCFKDVYTQFVNVYQQLQKEQLS